MSRLANLKLSTKLMLVLVPYSCCVTAFVVIGYDTLHRFQIGGPVYQRMIQRKDVIADVLPSPEYIIESYLVTLRLVDETDPEVRAELIERAGELRGDYEARHERWENELAPGELKDALAQDSYQPAIEFFDVRDRQLIPAVHAGNRSLARELANGVLLASFEQHRKAIDDVVRIATEENQRQERATETMIDRSSWLLTVIGIALVLMTAAIVLISWRFVWTLTGRIRSATSAATQIASGNLEFQIEKTSGDELGALSSAIASMAQSLSSLVSRVKRSSVEIMSTATVMSAAGKEQAETINGFGRATNEIAAAAKEISATGQELLATMDGVNTAAVDVATAATEGRKGLDGMDATMHQLADATTSISARLSAIREKASDINLAVTTITKVADQTNLLSVNAAIEAEKAGESGLGFLVLAREIRRLADQTAVATLDIDRMVREMQGAVSAGVMEMDKFSEQVRTGAGSVVEIGEQLAEIIQQVETISMRFVSVNEGMRTQALGAAQIDQSMVQLVEGARKSLGTVGELDGAIRELSSAVSNLDAGIAGFKID